MSGERVAVIGAGSWGTTVAAVAAGNAPAVLWARREELARHIHTRHENRDYLPGASLNATLTATSSLEKAAQGARVIVLAIPSHGVRDALTGLAPHVAGGTPVVSLVKGIESDTHLRMTQVVSELLPGSPAGVLTGPNIAREVADGMAAAAVIAMEDEELATELQGLFRTRRFRVYTGTDVVGAELGGAFKNVFAIAAGMAQGLDAGDNTRATVITRGLRELTCLGVACGGRSETFAGLAGMGDLLATCMSPSSRNRTLGEKLARGLSLDEITAEMKMVAEGIRSAPAVLKLADRHGVDMPIAREVAGVLEGDRSPLQAFRGLVDSKPTSELVPG